MKAIRIHAFGGPEVLTYEEIAVPEPGPGEARIKLEAIGLNFIDTYFRTGAYKTGLPLTLGQEGAGTVAAVGPGVTEVQPGDRVAYTGVMGSYADDAVVPAGRLVQLPAGVSAKQGAAIMLQGMTAHYLASSTFALKPGDTALVHAAAGGLGLLLVQVAKLRGARVFGTASTEQKAALARAAGADEVILYSQQDFVAEVKRLTNGRGVDVVYDSVGRTTFDGSLDCLRPRGYLVLCGQSSGAVPPLDPQVLNAKGALFLTRPTLAYYIANREELEWRTRELFDWIAAGKLDVRIGAEFPLAEAAAAHRAMEGRQTTGKTLLIP